MKFKYKIKKRQFMLAFFGIVFVLYIVRLIFPSIRYQTDNEATLIVPEKIIEIVKKHTHPHKTTLSGAHNLNEDLMKPTHDWKRHRTIGVHSYATSFPDINDVQLTAARKNGIKPVANRDEAERHKEKLVYMGISPYYNVKPLNNSIPYLVPRAQLLLTKIARNFLDSQYVKKVQPSKLLVTSVTRTIKDVESLQHKNTNATTNSCHCYGTTFDIGYNNYQPIQNPDSTTKRRTNDGSLKFILCEVLNDLRKQELCYVKYESKQGCFHITVR